MSKIYVGIDNGVSGGIAMLNENSELLELCPVPIQKTRSGKEVDILEFSRWIDEKRAQKTGEFMFILEQPCGSKSASAAASMAGAFNAFRALLELSRFRYERITAKRWQTEMIPSSDKTSTTKERALSRSKQLWPLESFIVGKKRTPHDGIIDAALIAEYARRAKL